MTVARPIRFGVNSSQTESGAAWADYARRLESLGYSTLFMPDTMGPTLSPMPALAMAAAVTSTLRVGTYVLANDVRNPLEVAREAAAIDFLSGGRMELGMGLGRAGAESDNAKLGIPSDSVAVRGERLSESVDIIRRLFAGEKVTAAGTHYAVRDAEIFPRPVQQPGPPILIAAAGPKGLRRAAAIAEIVALALPMTATEAELESRVALLRDAAGERLAAVEMNVMLTALPEGPNGEPVRRAAYGMARWSGIDLEAAMGSAESYPLLLTGSVEAMAERVLGLRDRFGITYFNTTQFAAEAMAPVVERVRAAG